MINISEIYTQLTCSQSWQQFYRLRRLYSSINYFPPSPRQTKDENDDIVEGGWEAITIDMEEWNLLVCQLENLIDIDCFIHSNHSKSLLSGVQSPTLKNHIHSAEKKRSRNNKTDDSPKKDPDTSKMSDRLAMLSVKGILR